MVNIGRSHALLTLTTMLMLTWTLVSDYHFILSVNPWKVRCYDNLITQYRQSETNMSHLLADLAEIELNTLSFEMPRHAHTDTHIHTHTHTHAYAQKRGHRVMQQGILTNDLTRSKWVVELFIQQWLIRGWKTRGEWDAGESNKYRSEKAAKQGKYGTGIKDPKN